jgi:glycosyltransferase involved in cell wall biosynthesis
MSCGLPIVAYNVPFGPSLMLKDDVNGFLVTDADNLSYAARLSQLLSDLPLRIQFGSQAQQSSMHYQAKEIMPLWKNLFENVIAPIR